mmetsp:Transcript_11444/g.42979  ORF Transcript_11444/g.42979 Transcript_11444/m.42979 type:complete len:463 (+) Transcript_11444:2-1390(+)
MKPRLVFHIFLIRLSICVLIILANLLVSDYDLSSFIPPRLVSSTSESVPFVDRLDSSLTSNLFGFCYFIASSFVSWDAVYFVEISQNLQYRMEHMHAFFPGMPALVFIGRRLLFDWWIQQVDTSYITTVFCAVLLSNVSFIVSCVALYHLTRAVFGSAIRRSKFKPQTFTVDTFCTLVCYLYALSPASVFCSVPYTESLFALLSFVGMYLWTTSEGNSLWAALFFGLATFVRGNGILLAGFFVYGMWKKRSSRSRFPLQMILNWTPYVAVQYLAYMYYCTKLNENITDLSLEATKTFLQLHHPWCLKTLPHLYSYAQKKYWNVGFFRYWTVAQIPNFLLASPVVCIALWGIFKYCEGRVAPFLLVRPLQVSKDAKRSPHQHWFQLSQEAAVYVYYLLFMVLYILLGAHVQILTRFLVASPALHWITAFLFLQNTRWRRFISLFHFVFVVAGCTLFPNFYPWT